GGYLSTGTGGQAPGVTGHVADQAGGIGDDVVDQVEGVFQDMPDQMRDADALPLCRIAQGGLKIARDTGLDDPVLALGLAGGPAAAPPAFWSVRTHLRALLRARHTCLSN